MRALTGNESIFQNSTHSWNITFINSLYPFSIFLECTKYELKKR
jgi:hypothetical protein